MTKDVRALALLVQNLINDETLHHLSIKDLKNVLLNVQGAFEEEEEEDDGDNGERNKLILKYVL